MSGSSSQEELVDDNLRQVTESDSEELSDFNGRSLPRYNEYGSESTAKQGHRRERILVNKSTQFDNTAFVEYILSFLNILEEEMKNERLKVNDLPGYSEVQNHFNMEKKKEKQIRFQEMQQILGKIRGLKSGNGDVFFLSLAKVFFATSSVPWNHQVIIKQETKSQFSYDQKVQVQRQAGGGITYN